MANSGDPLRWALGVVTCPRQDGYYLDQCLNSLSTTGFPEPVVFAEPKSPIPESFKGHVCCRRKQYGDWSNWATGLFELLLSEPDADYFLMAEDDAFFAKGCRAYLEYAIPMLGPFGSVSLYTPSIYHKENIHGFHNELLDDRTWSTVTVIMSKQGVISFFSDPLVQKHRFENIFNRDEAFWQCSVDPKNSIKDAVIGQWASKHDLPIYYHTPALAEHIGVRSTLSEQESTSTNGRMTASFVGPEVDVSEWVGKPFHIQPKTKVALL